MQDIKTGKINKKPELLAPAGDYGCFLAAVLAGCDAVYLSGENYGARAYAKNFSTDEVIKAIETAHLYGVKVYLTVNTLFKNDEIGGLHNYLLPFYEAGLDSVIVQDVGVISYINEHFPNLNIHASTQLAITSFEGLKLLHKLNVKRCVLARELSIDEIRHIHENDDMELECFIHGALCYSYSGKCLLSSMIGGRSGNRGRCAGSCRQPYNGKYLLSTKDICCLEILPELISAGITSFKIEGRMKSADYVYGVTSIYRKYIDSACNGNDFKRDLDTLEKLYTRGGNSKGYYFKNNGRDMISLDDASYRRDLNDENVVSYVPEKIKITGEITVKTGENLKLVLSCNDACVECTGEPVIKAEKTPVDEKSVRKQIVKTGDTVFEFDKLTCDISDDAFVRVADLNKIRREGLEKLKDKLLESTRREGICECEEQLGISENNFVSSIYNATENTSDTANGHKIAEDDYKFTVTDYRFTADICTAVQFDACILNPKISRIYIPFALWQDDNSVISNIHESGKEVYIKFQSVIRHQFIGKNADEILLAASLSDGVLVDNNELLYFFPKNNYNKPVVGDIHMYCLNDRAYKTYKSLGMTRLTYPIELNRRELLNIYRAGDELIIYGYTPVMVSAQCVNNTLNGCDNTYKQIKLNDRKGAEFTCVNDCKNCTNIIYNSVPMSLHDDGKLFSDLKPESLKICLTIEDKKSSAKIVKFFTYDCGFSKNDKNKPPYADFTKGHLNRGVL